MLIFTGLLQRFSSLDQVPMRDDFSVVTSAAEGDSMSELQRLSGELRETREKLARLVASSNALPDEDDTTQDLDISSILDEAKAISRESGHEVDLRELGKEGDLSIPENPPELKPMLFERPPERQLRWDCEGNPYMSGNRTTPKRIVDLLLFAYEFDILELRLYELDPVVDVFVILETTRALKKWEKPLMLGSVITSPRFRRFRHKIMYSVFDDSTHGRYRGFKSRKERNRAIRGREVCEPLDSRFPVTLPSLFFAQNFAWKRSGMNVLNSSPHIFDEAAMRRNDLAGLLQPVSIINDTMVESPCSEFLQMSSEADILKFLAYSDAGKLPRSDFDEDIAAALARYPHMGTVWKVCAVRVSDPSDVLLTKRVDYDTWIPWYACPLSA
ncbi:Beta-1,4-mannosyl-glycoprotein 4-beta-N-acetylglucosaminyltransferase [Perkinsus olseni]|uniref:Beta-1,4-mannosyl-glycoprotein 4-beta-N-acetylglucosaminyltransferase n=1 Tax=Perkinsus olseni TaxID=32597 RepID=A0A7J6R793_PEROL|nr:Beta-1,4-mannosyl-glycoprotein 4-beta-N-acetylglucosaminyltransferase [Perkinsus olseni]KAF4729317.1 Beta-1,4-mannosyl-glycoprotein 4-beta-N-acetylglucosaminyltransferase [Perkinsus olseni]